MSFRTNVLPATVDEQSWITNATLFRVKLLLLITDFPETTSMLSVLIVFSKKVAPRQSILDILVNVELLTDPDRNVVLKAMLKFEFSTNEFVKETPAVLIEEFTILPLENVIMVTVNYSTYPSSGKLKNISDIDCERVF